MLEAIRARALDLYAALQLDPRAKPALVAAMYAMLTERARAAPETLARLRAAHSLLIDIASRGAYDRVHGHGERRAARNHYELLGVAIDADAAAIDLAYSVGTRNGAAAPAPISSAYRTLSNPYLRARYDASLAAPVHPATAPSTLVHVPHSTIESRAYSTTAFERRMTLTTPPTAPAAPAHQSNDQTANSVATPGDAPIAAPESSEPAWSTFPPRKAMLARLNAAEPATAPRRTAPPLDPAPAITAARDDRSDLPPPASITPNPRHGQPLRPPAPETTAPAPSQRLPRHLAPDAMTARLLELAPSPIAPARSTPSGAPPRASGTPPIRWALVAADD